ncbi:GntR family transcriptional regulator [Pseudomonas violetae]|jgi:DNA-binding GntR family transcriptional regulator|uniref:GntR family transcriptional regulator n=1 Tax=Pseudomonas violetae TaxID=2915813 RepID=A0ABT0F443_9PSED|nr:GntR family transcriptional regulator [Pseudomonas violetae]MCK1792491.1 GntR family transcriptional regulator [Pseudomonas violetae]
MNSFASPQTLAALPYTLPMNDLYARVFDAILDQRINAGSRFTEDSLTQMFGARRSDIRGVLGCLSHQQIIILRANHRPRVAVLDREQIQQTLHARRLTETTLVQLACQNGGRQDFERLRALIEQEQGCTEQGRAIRLSGEFHLQLAEMAGNAPLAHFLGSLVPLTSLAIAQQEAHPGDSCEWTVHEAIVNAVERGDAVAAQALLNQHLDHLDAVLLNSQPNSRKNRAVG